MKTKKEFAQFFKSEIEPGISPTDKPALRQAWNDTIDGMCKAGELPERARDWSHPKRFYTRIPKTKLVYVLKWRGEDIDEAETVKYRNYLIREYNMAYNGGVSYVKRRVSAN